MDDFEAYVDQLNSANRGEFDDQATQSFKKFTQKRRRQVYQSLNLVEELRFNAFMEAFSEKTRNRVEKFIQQLPGNELKIGIEVSRAVTTCVKIHAGQLVEMAKEIQIEELKTKLAHMYPIDPNHQKTQEMPPNNSKEFLVCGNLMSKEARESLPK